LSTAKRLPQQKNTLSRKASLIVLLSSGLLLTACSAGSGDRLDLGGRPLSEGGDVPLAATLASIQSNVFNPFCVVCHAGAAAPQGLRLDSANSFASLVGVPSRESGSILRVTPGNPDQSYLVQKLEGSASVGEQMPFGGPPLPQSTINFVRQWISDGALPIKQDNESPPVLTSMTPEHLATESNFPAQILATFDQEIDASTINSQTFLLTRSGGDGRFDNGNEVLIAPASVGLASLNPRLAIMDLGGVQPVDDDYHIELKGAGPSLVLNLGGTALDGEFIGEFPSGDGIEGGDFLAQFSVVGIQPTLNSIQDNVFTPVCSACHSGPTGPALPAGMDLRSAGASYENLVGVPSLEQNSLLRVNPGDPDMSYIVQKLEGTATVGARMPFGGPFLEQTTIAAVRQWIADGASP
jgi:cytochrome c5